MQHTDLYHTRKSKDGVSAETPGILQYRQQTFIRISHQPLDGCHLLPWSVRQNPSMRQLPLQRDAPNQPLPTRFSEELFWVLRYFTWIASVRVEHPNEAGSAVLIARQVCPGEVFEFRNFLNRFIHECPPCRSLRSCRLLPLSCKHMVPEAQ